MRNDILFTTICISDPEIDSDRTHFRGKNYYFKTANILVNSVLKNTKHSIMVVTDVPDKFIKSERVIIHDITQLTTEPRIINGYMNFHLKRHSLKLAFETEYKYVIYVDCDLFINNLNEDIFHWVDKTDVDVIGKLGVSDIGTCLHTTTTKEKIQQFGLYWNDEFINATLPFEMFMIFKKNGKKQNMFIEMWDNVARESLNHNISTIYDSYYIGVALYYARMNKLNLQQSDDLDLLDITKKFFDGIRIIHDGKVCTIDIYQLEDFEYETLLKRVIYAV